MTVNERPLAEMLANDVLRDPITHGWLAPLAREYLKEIAREKHPILTRDEEQDVTGWRKP